MKSALRLIAISFCASLAAALSTPLSADTAAVDTGTTAQSSKAASPRIDYSYWDQALKHFVYEMGRSDRTSARTVQPITGTLLVYGHESRLRLEGNRVAFSFLEPEQIAAISAYRRDLEQVAA
ncbi:hypothetical protein [Erythrobacter litoralis]|uniref:Uncharacterized protein n=1 Tax=Erythrobacter litoralis (strain HTCC2594) TaxID=314225 RepID=Q2N8L1_ERYLH|nr:hypothetical protein [Erythrobacter litoralis]ABC63980.1 hypothetical protein ELI_09440 [Erythrobacter litoralis HTCC2594]